MLRQDFLSACGQSLSLRDALWGCRQVINSAVLFKVGWTTVFFRSQGSVALHAAVALTALAMCDVALLAFMRGGKTKKAK